MLLSADNEVGRRRPRGLTRDIAATALPELLRTSLACLLLATAFAGFARRAGVELSLLEEMQQRLRRLRRFRLGTAQKRSDADYIRELAGDRED